MFTTPRVLRALFALFVAVSLFAGSTSAFATSSSVVISQIYGAGGNSGATLNQDYVELFNLSSTPVSLAGYSLQYRSTAGTSMIPATEIAPLPSVTLQPGQFYLFGASSPSTTVGAAVAADAQLTPYLNLAGGAGQVYLVNSGVAIAAGCNTADPSIVDQVGYGTGTTCSEGGTVTGTLSATLAAFRTRPCVDTDNNAADFSTAAPAPRNSTTTFQPCATGTSSPFTISSAAVSPTSASIGSAILLTARVTPGNSTGIAITVDLSGLGGSSTQPLYDDGTHGDTTAGDNIYSFSATVGGTPAAGTVTLKFSGTDGQAHTATASATLTIQASSAVIPIHTIQTGAPSSAYQGQVVTTTGIVTAVVSGGFYLEARDSAQDADPNTSEAIFVVSGTNASVVAGNELNVTGTVTRTSSFASTPATEIAGTVTVTVVTTGNPLPTPLVLKVSDDTTTGGFGQFLRFQSMRISIPNFITTAPTGGSLNEAAEMVTSNGEFYGTVAGVTRPFVEPGVSVLETSLPTGATYCTATVTANCVARFDGNPENLLIESTAFGGTALDVTSNQTITNLLGIMSFNNNYQQLLLDPKTPGTLGTPMTYIAVPVTAANEFTVSSMNIERFYSTVPSTGAVTLTPEAYARRLNKVSLLLRNVQRMPDIVGLQEVGTLATLNDIAAKISTDAIAAGQTDPKYSTCLITGNDSTGINTAFLVKTTRVTVVDCSQFGKSTTFTNSLGNQATLNDRPPLVLHATVNITGYPAYQVTVISNHLKSLIGIDDTTSTGATVRLKKENQDEFLAALIQGYQANGEHVVSVGDYNSFFVNDGYVDNIGVITGNPPAAGTVVVGPTAAYVAPSPTLVDLETTITDPLQRYDYTFIGNAQTLDHIIVTKNMLAGAHLAFSHEDADFPLVQYNDASTPQSTSDHDGAVAFFPLLGAGQTSSASMTPATQSFGSVIVAASSAASAFTVTNTGNTSININSVTTTGDFARTTTCGTTLAAGATCTVSVTFTPTAAGARTGSLIVTTTAISNTTLTAALTGTGVTAAASLTLTPASAAYGSVTVGQTSAAQVFTLTNSGNVTATLASIAAASPFASTTTCGASLAAGANCTISVSFAPKTAGAQTALLSVTSSASTAALTSTLTGTGVLPVDFTLTPATLSGTTAAGTAASFNLTLSSISQYTGTVRISCTGAPAGSVCTPSATALTLAASAAGTVNPLNLQVVITTSKTSSGGVTSARGPMALAALLAAVAGCVLVFRSRRRFRIATLLSALVALTLYTVGCGSGSSPAGGVTPPGTYTYTVTATDGTLSHTATYTLTVQ